MNNLTSSLYAVRAGLSVISKEKDIATHILDEASSEFDKECDELNCCIKQAGELVDSAYKRMSNARVLLADQLGAREAYDKANPEKSAIKSDVDRQRRYVDDERFKAELLRGAGIRSLLCFVIPFIIAIIASIILVCYCVVEGVKWNKPLEYICIITISICIIVCCFAFYYVFIDENSSWKEYSKEKSCYDMALRHLQEKEDEYEELTEDLQAKKDRLKQIEEKIEVGLLQYRKEIDESLENRNQVKEEVVRRKDEAQVAYNKKITEAQRHVAAGYVMAEQLNNQFRDIIDSRDWKNIDLLIYYLETRRAETLKEALLLADRELQTERIVSSVNNATSQICSTIHSELQDIRNGMAMCCNILLNSINDNFEQLTAEIKPAILKIGKDNFEQMKSLNSYVGQLTTQNDMCNALLEKANVTSLRLVDDVKSIQRMIKEKN